MPTKHAAVEHASGLMMQELVREGELDQGLRPKLADVLIVRAVPASPYMPAVIRLHR
jgi:hypothetical protein